MTTQQRLTQEQLFNLIAYDCETGDIYRKFKNGQKKLIEVKPNPKTGYKMLRLCVDGDSKKYASHRLAFLYQYGYQPEQIDHINGDRTDNRIANLKASTNSENCKNRRKRADNTSEYTGVHFNKSHNKWIARININGKRVIIGEFKDKDDAIKSRVIAIAGLDEYSDRHGL